MNGAEKYNTSWFDKQKIGASTSAGIILPIVVDLISPRSVIDVGCGVGSWLSFFLKNGVKDIFGIDGDWVKENQLQIPVRCFKSVDVSKTFNIGRKADLVMCLEVGEHLPNESAGGLIHSLTECAPIVLFSAAIPYQPGTGHINGQWPEYWANIFKQHGYIPIDAIRRKVWSNPDVEYWYAQNIFLYVKESDLSKYPKLEKEVACGYSSALPLVHPERYRYALKPAPTVFFRIIRRLRKLFGLSS